MKRKTTIIIIGLLSMQLLATSRDISLVECNRCVQDEMMEKTKQPPAASEEYPEITPLAVTLFQI